MNLARAIDLLLFAAMPATIPVSFAHGFADSSYRLFELDEPVLQEVLKNDGQ